MPSTTALLKAAARYDQMGYSISDHDLMELLMDARGQGVACGNSWIPRSKKCSRDKAKTTSKENLKRTTEKGKARQQLRAEVEGRKRPEIASKNVSANTERSMTPEQAKYTKAIKSSIKKLEKKINEIWDAGLHGGGHREVYKKWLEAKERVLDKKEWRWLEDKESKASLEQQISALTKEANKVLEATSDAYQYANEMQALRLKKEAQIRTNIKNWQAM